LRVSVGRISEAQSAANLQWRNAPCYCEAYWLIKSRLIKTARCRSGAATAITAECGDTADYAF